MTTIDMTTPKIIMAHHSTGAEPLTTPKRICLLFLCFLSAILANAQPIPVETAQKAGNRFLQQMSPATTSPTGELALAQIGKAATMQKSGDSIPCYYVFNRAEGGFVIVAARENVVPILAYSLEGSFQPKNLPDNMKDMLLAMREEIAEATLAHAVAAPKVKTQWESLCGMSADGSNGTKSEETEKPGTVTGIFPDAANTTLYNTTVAAVEPLTSHIYWDQWPYFNDSCPYDANVSNYYGHRCPAGCTATAMAIIIRYWKYPAHGYGSHSYTHNTYGTLSANFGETYYDYANMPEYLSALPRAAQRRAISQLLYHCGVAVNMHYSATGSGAYVYAYWNNNANDALNAFRNYFGYSHAQGVRKKDYTDSEWKKLLKEQLCQKQPIIFSGFHPDPGSGDGHAFVCDGYDQNDLFHFNWGWNGAYNCYCTIDSLCPGGTGTGGGKGNYSRNQDAVINISPYLETTDLGWENADAYTGSTVSKTQDIWLFPDSSLRICSAEGSETTHTHSMGTMFRPTAKVFGPLNNRMLFRFPYRLDSLRIRYHYHWGERQQSDARPDTLKLHLSYYRLEDSNYRIIPINQTDYLCPKITGNPACPVAENHICLSYPLTAADTAKSMLSIPINYLQVTALGYDIPEDALLNVMLQFVPGYTYRPGDTLCLVTNEKTAYYHNAFALTCLSSKQADAFAGGQYNAALTESSETETETDNDTRCYTPSLYAFPQWDYYLQYNTQPSSAYVEQESHICGSPHLWDKLLISQDGDYQQIFTSKEGKDSIVTLHVRIDQGIGTMGSIHGVTQIDSTGYYDFYIEPVENAAYYQWNLNSPLWQLQSDSLQSRLAVTGRSSGTIEATAFSRRGICRTSSHLHLAFCDSMGTVTEIQGLDHISRDGVYYYYIDSVDKAVSYQWTVLHDGWEIDGKNGNPSVLIHIGQSGADSLYLTVSDECGYTTSRSLLIQSSVGIAEKTVDGRYAVCFPNPAQEKVTLLLTQGSDESTSGGTISKTFSDEVFNSETTFEASLTDAYGRCLQTQKFTGNACTFRINDYAAGVYFIRLLKENRRIGTYKIIKS